MIAEDLIKCMIQASLHNLDFIQKWDEYIYNRYLPRNQKEEKKVYDYFMKQVQLSMKDNSMSAIYDNCLAICFDNEIGTEGNETLAKQYYKSSARKGLLMGQINYACILRLEAEEKKDQDTAKEAYDIYLDLSSKNHHSGFNGLGLCYEIGIGVAKNEYLAFDHYKTAADLNNLPAKVNLASCYLVGFGTTLNSQMVFRTLSSIKNIPFSKSVDYYLGLCYRDGIGCEQDEEKSFYYFHQAALRNHTKAKEIVIKMYCEQKQFREALLFCKQDDENFQFMVKVYSKELKKISDSYCDTIMKIVNDKYAVKNIQNFPCPADISLYYSCILGFRLQFLFQIFSDKTYNHSLFYVPPVVVLVSDYL